MDWTDDFIERFRGYRFLERLKERRFHGKLIINFCEGTPQSVHIEWCVRGKKRECEAVT